MTVTNSPIKLSSIFILFGFIMTLGTIGLTIIDFEAGQYHDPTNPAEIISEITSNESRSIVTLVAIALDNLFIIGYVGIFYAIYLYTRHTGYWAKLALILGLSTATFDLIENAIQIALIRGISNGWDPNSLIWVILWSVTFIKDISSYLAGLIFIIILLYTLNDSAQLRRTKLIVSLLLAVYVIIGSLSLINPIFLVIRNLSFVVDLLIAGILFYRTPEDALPTL